MAKKFYILTKEHNLEKFDCGDQTINEYLKKFALRFQEDRIHKCWLFIEDKNIIGYIALSVHHIKHKFSKIKFKTKWGIYPPYTPCLFIDMLGIDSIYSSTSKKYGTKLIYQTIKIADKINQDVGVRLILLEALPNSLGFYYKNGFSILFNKENLKELKKFKDLFNISFNINEKNAQIWTSDDNFEKIRFLQMEDKINPILMFFDLL